MPDRRKKPLGWTDEEWKRYASENPVTYFDYLPGVDPPLPPGGQEEVDRIYRENPWYLQWSDENLRKTQETNDRWWQMVDQFGEEEAGRRWYAKPEEPSLTEDWQTEANKKAYQEKITRLREAGGDTTDVEFQGKELPFFPETLPPGQEPKPVVRDEQTQKDIDEFYDYVKQTIPDYALAEQENIAGGMTPEEAKQVNLKNIQQWIDANPQDIQIALTPQVQPQQTETIVQMFNRMFPEAKYVSEEFMQTGTVQPVIDFLQTEGQNQDTEAFLKSIGATDEQIQTIFETQLPEWNPYRQEIIPPKQSRELPFEGVRNIPIEDFWNLTKITVSHAVNQTKQWLQKNIPETFIVDVKLTEQERRALAKNPEELASIEALASRVNPVNEVKREQIRQVLARNEMVHQQWLNSQAGYTPDWDVPILDVIKGRSDIASDPSYWIAQMMKGAPVMATIIGAGIVAGPPGVVGALTVTAPAAMQDFHDNLVAQGVPEEQATKLGNIGGVFVQGLMMIPAGKVLNGLAPNAARIMEGELTKSTANYIIKQKLYQMTETELAFQLQVAATNITQDAMVALGKNEQFKVDTNKLVGGVLDAAVTSLPFVALGAMGSTRPVTREELAKSTPRIREIEGWIQDPTKIEQEGEWLRPIRGSAEWDKQPWQMTQEEYVALEGRPDAMRHVSETNHHISILNALDAGKDVPFEVAKAYPDTITRVKPPATVTQTVKPAPAVEGTAKGTITPKEGMVAKTLSERIAEANAAIKEEERLRVIADDLGAKAVKRYRITHPEHDGILEQPPLGYDKAADDAHTALLVATNRRMGAVARAKPTGAEQIQGLKAQIEQAQGALKGTGFAKEGMPPEVTKGEIIVPRNETKLLDTYKPSGEVTLPQGVRPITPEELKVGDIFSFRGDKSIGGMSGKVIKVNPVTVVIETDYMGKPMTLTMKKSELRGEGRALVPSGEVTLPKTEPVPKPSEVGIPPMEPPKPPTAPGGELSPETGQPRTLPEQVKDLHAEITKDIDALKQSVLKGNSPEATTSRLVLKGSERVLSEANGLLRKIEQGIKVDQTEIDSLNKKLTTARTIQDRLIGQVQEVQDKLASLRDVTKFEKSQEESVKQTLTDYIRETLPLEERGKLLIDVRDAKTPEDLQVVMAKASEFAEQSAKKGLTQEIVSELESTKPTKEGDILKGKYTPEVQDTLDTIRDNLKLDRTKVRDKIEENIAAIDAGAEDAVARLDQNELLDLAGIDGMDTIELANTLDSIRILKETGKFARATAREKAKAEFTTFVKDVVDNEITGGKGVIPGRESKAAAAEPKKSSIVNLNFMRNIYTLGDLIAGKAGKKFQETKLYNFLQDNVYKPKIAEETSRRVDFEEFQSKVMEAIGVKKTKDIEPFLRKLSNEAVALTGKTTEGKEITLELTKAEIISYYQWSLNPKLNRTFEEGMKWGWGIRNAINDSLTPQEKAFSKVIMDTYQKMWEKWNPVYRDRYGVNMPRDPHYSPFVRDYTTQVPEPQMIFKDFSALRSKLPSAIKARTENILSLNKTDAVKAFMNHVNQMEFFVHQSEGIKNLRTLSADPSFKVAVEQNYGTRTLAAWNKNIRILADRGDLTAQTVRQLDWLRRNSSVAQLAIKPIQFLNQVPTMLVPLTEINPLTYGKGIADFWSHARANVHEMMTEHPWVIDRYKGMTIERDVNAAISSERFRPITGKSSVKDLMYFPMTLGDKFGTLQSYWTMYKEGLVKFGTDAAGKLKAQEYAGMASDRMQNTSSLDTLSSLQSGGSFWKLATMYTSQPTKYFQIIDVGVRDLMMKRGSPIQAAQAILVAGLILPALFQFTKDAFQFKKDKQFSATLLSQVNNILVYGQMFQTVENWITGDMFEYQPSPVMSIPRDFYTFVQKLSSYIGKVKDPFTDITVDDVMGVVEALAKPIGSVSGLPVPYLLQVEKMLRGQTDKSGQVTRDPRELVFSRFALKEPTPDLAQKARDAEGKLGSIMDTNIAADKIPQLKDMSKLASEFKTLFEETLPSDISAKNGYSPIAESYGKMKLAKDASDSLPNMKLHEIVDSIEKDKTLSFSIAQYYLNWKAKQDITSLDELKKWHRDNPRGQLGNLSKEQYDLLTAYQAADAMGRKKMVETNPALSANPYEDNLKKSPAENALLALWGQEKVLTLAAYNQAKSMIKDLGLSDVVIEGYLPPDAIAKPYFDFLDAVSTFTSGSAEAHLIRVKTKGLDDFLNKGKDVSLAPIERPVESLQLTVDNRKTSDKVKSWSDENSPNYLDDVRKDQKAPDGKMVTKRELAKINLQATGEGKKYYEDLKRIEVYDSMTKTGGAPNPVTETIKALGEKYVEYGKVEADPKLGEAESNLFRYENPELDKWGTTKDANGKSKWKPLDPGMVRIWKIDRQYRKQDTEYEALPEDTATSKKRHDYLADPKNVEYRITRYKRDAYRLKMTEDVSNTYVAYHEIIFRGKPADQKEPSYEDEWFLMEHPDFYKQMVGLGQFKDDPKRFDKIPTRQIFVKWQIYNQYTDTIARQKYRYDNPDFDDWYVLAGHAEKKITKDPTINQKVKAAANLGTVFGRRMASIDEMLAALRGRP